MNLKVGGTAGLLAGVTASKDSQQSPERAGVAGKCCRRKATVAPWDNSLAEEEPDILVCAGKGSSCSLQQPGRVSVSSTG